MTDTEYDDQDEIREQNAYDWDRVQKASAQSGCAGLTAFVIAFAAALLYIGLSSQSSPPAPAATVDASAGPTAAFQRSALPSLCSCEAPSTTAPTTPASSAPPSSGGTQPTTGTSPTTQPTGTTQPPPTCGYPSSIGVSGANVSSLGGSGGSFTVTGATVTLSVGGLVSCGPHYELGFSSSGGGSGYDCETGGFSFNISPYVHSGETVSVYFDIPPTPHC